MNRFFSPAARPSRFLTSLLVVLAGCALADEPSPVLQARLLKVTDGDSLRVQLDSGPIEIRLHGIDAPEVRPRRQRFGPEATKVLTSLLTTTALEIEPVEQDRYDRMVARVFVNGRDVNAAMLEAGFAWAYRDYLDSATRHYCDLEAVARDAGRGIWVGDPAGWHAPWEFRRSRGAGSPRTDFSGETAAACRTAIPASRPGASALQPAPGNCRIKGNINARGERIYHLPGSRSYEATKINNSKGERWFCTEAEARAAGWRAPYNPR